MQTKAQSMVEYSVLFCIILAALLVMSVYMKRAMQGRLRGSAEDLSQGGFYSPGATNVTLTTITHSYETSQSLNLLNNTTNETSGAVETIGTSEMFTQTHQEEELAPFAEEPRRW